MNDDERCAYQVELASYDPVAVWRCDRPLHDGDVHYLALVLQ